MESDLLKLLGTGGSQLLLVAGYMPLLWLIRKLWEGRDALQQKFIDMLAAKFMDAANAKELWIAQARVIEDQTRQISDLKAQIVTLIDELRRARA